MNRRRAGYRRVWFLGDSLTAGYDAGSAAAAFPAAAAQALRAKQAGCAEVVHNANRFGGRVQDGIRAVMADAGFLPDLVVLQFGENDHPWDLAFRARYRRLVSLFLRCGARPLVAAISVWDPSASDSARSMNADIRDLVEVADGVFVHVTDAAAQARAVQAGRAVDWLSPGRISDGFHPSDSGHAEIAHRLVETLEAEVASGPARRQASARRAARVSRRRR